MGQSTNEWILGRASGIPRRFCGERAWDRDHPSLWNPVNTDTKGTYQSVRIIRVSVLNGLSEKDRDGHFFY